MILTWLRRRPWLIPLLVILAALGYFGLRPVPKLPLTIGVGVGQIAPNFTLPTLGGGTIRLWKLRGHPVWLNFFASWCPACRREAPTIERIARGNPGLRIIGMDLAGSEVSLQSVRDFVAKYRLTYPVAIDQGNAVANRYEVDVIPVSMFIDSRGVIRTVDTGQMLPAMVRSALRTVGYEMR